MKKRNLIILICIIIVLGCITLYFKRNQLLIGGVSHTIVENEYISMTIKEGTLKKTGTTILLKNNSLTDFQYCSDYEIEKKQEGLWHNIGIAIDFICESDNLKVSETKEIDLEWENTYGKLTSGTYRIIKTIYRDYPNDPMNKFYASVEFTVK